MRPATRHARRSSAGSSDARHHLVPSPTAEYPGLLRSRANWPHRALCLGTPRRAQRSAARRGRQPQSDTSGGKDTAFEFSRSLAERGLVIASGLAAGIDTAAHRGALAAQGLTLAVLGNGHRPHLSREQPGLERGHSLAGALRERISLGTPPRRVNFPRRNRIIAALCIGTLVVEAARRARAR